LSCTLLAFWDEDQEEAWLLLTDLAPEASEASWYGLRSWIEPFFKDCKRGGWQWQQTRMTDAGRAERLWLVIALGTLWLVQVGGVDESVEAAALPDVEVLGVQGGSRRRRYRLVSVFVRGWAVMVAALLNPRRLPLGRLFPEPWPAFPLFSEPQKRPQQDESNLKTYP